MQSLQMTSLMSELIDPLCIELSAYLSSALSDLVSEPIQFTTDADWGLRHQMLHDQVVDIAWICGLLYTETVARPGTYKPCVAPCMAGEDRPIYYGEFITKRAKSSLADDRRKLSWAYNELESFSGYHIMRAYFEKVGQDQADFASIVCSGSHLKSLKMVRAGQVDTATIDSTTLQMMAVREPELMDEIALIERIGPYPAPAITISSNCSDELFQAIQITLADMHHTQDGSQLLAAWQIDRFEAVTDHTYDDIRDLMARADYIKLR